MATAHVPGEEFDFTKVALQDPTAGGGRGAGYFSKAVFDDSRALLFQTPPSFSKAGIISTSRSNHIDIIIDNDSKLAAWLGDLEAHMLEEITQNAGKWFTSPMTSDEINYLLVPTSKMYKKQTYMRATLPVARYAGQGKGVFVFDESENPVPQTDILDSTRFIGVIEVAGMRFTTTAMRLELVLKQVMVLGDTATAPVCLVRRADTDTRTIAEDVAVLSADDESGSVQALAEQESSANASAKTDAYLSEHVDVPSTINEKPAQPPPNDDDTETPTAKLVVEDGSKRTADESGSNGEQQIATDDIQVVENDAEDSNSTDYANRDGGIVGSSVRKAPVTLEEVVIEPPATSKASIDLKEKSDVYQDLYEELYARARDAKKYAIKLYLEAQELQTEHALDAIESSDNESELEEVLH